MSLRLSDYDYDLPRDLIAQYPARPRDSSRLLVVRRDGGGLEHRVFRDLPEYLPAGDVIVLNDTKVLPVRLRGRRPSGGAVEVLLLNALASDGPRQDEGERWEALVRPGRRLRPGTRVRFGDGAIEVTIGESADDGTRVVTVHHAGTLRSALGRAGELPVPPYIERPL